MQIVQYGAKKCDNLRIHYRGGSWFCSYFWGK